jgi:hypothetical protein
VWARRFARERLKKMLNKPGNRFVSGLHEHELGDHVWLHGNDIDVAIGVQRRQLLVCSGELDGTRWQTTMLVNCTTAILSE